MERFARMNEQYQYLTYPHLRLPSKRLPPRLLHADF
jgi:hypothetical protein